MYNLTLCDALGPVCLVCNRGLGIRLLRKPEKRKRRETKTGKVYQKYVQEGGAKNDIRSGKNVQ